MKNNFYSRLAFSYLACIVPRNMMFYSTNEKVRARIFDFYLSSKNQKLVFRCFSTLYKLNNFKNPLQLEDGKFDYISNVRTPKEFRWVKGGNKVREVGVIGFERGQVVLNHEYVEIAADRLNEEKYKSTEKYSIQDGYFFITEQQRLGNLNEIKFNGGKLESILKGFNHLCSHSMAFVVYHGDKQGYYTIGKHYLVTNLKSLKALELINDVYNKFENLTVRYDFNASDGLIIRY